MLEPKGTGLECWMPECLYKTLIVKGDICPLSTRTLTLLQRMVCFFVFLFWSGSFALASLIGRCLFNVLRCHSALLPSLRNLAEAASHFLGNAFSVRVREDNHCLCICAKCLHFLTTPPGLWSATTFLYQAWQGKGFPVVYCLKCVDWDHPETISLSPGYTWFVILFTNGLIQFLVSKISIMWMSGAGVWAFWMFLTKTDNVIESFMWTHFEVLLKNLNWKWKQYLWNI